MYDCVCDCTILPIILPTQSDAFIFFFLLYTLYVNFHSELGLLLKKRGFYLTVDVVIQQTNIWKIFRFGFKLYVRALLYQLKLIFFHPILLLFTTRYLMNTKLSEILLLLSFFESICMSFLLYECWFYYICVLINILICVTIYLSLYICIDIWCLDHVLFCHVRIHTVLLIHPELIAAQWISKNTKIISFTFSLPESTVYFIRSNYLVVWWARPSL